MERVITCINCPVGCRMTVGISDEGEILSVSGNTCIRGEKYARQECTQPQRIVTAVIPVEGSAVPLSVKTNLPVPKAMIKDIMRELSCVQPVLPIQAGAVIVPNILHTGSDIIATRSLH